MLTRCCGAWPPNTRLAALATVGPLPLSAEDNAALVPWFYGVQSRYQQLLSDLAVGSAAETQAVQALVALVGRGLGAELHVAAQVLAPPSAATDGLGPTERLVLGELLVLDAILQAYASDIIPTGSTSSAVDMRCQGLLHGLVNLALAIVVIPVATTATQQLARSASAFLTAREAATPATAAAVAVGPVGWLMRTGVPSRDVAVVTGLMAEAARSDFARRMVGAADRWHAAGVVLLQQQR